MTLHYAYCYLVPPQRKKESRQHCTGAEVQPKSRLFKLLTSIFAKSTEECKLPVSFIPDGGVQSNATRDLLLKGVETGDLSGWQPLADHLSHSTSEVSGLALFFVMHSQGNGSCITVLARFPADTGVLADMEGQELKVELVEKVFMKNSRAYKAARFADANPHSGYWESRVVDRQLHGTMTSGTNYWIREFLRSDYKTNPEVGSRRIAQAVKAASKNTNLSTDIKEEIAAVHSLLKGMDGEVISPAGLCKRFALGKEASDAILSEIKPPRLRIDEFAFQYSAYAKIAKFRVISLNNDVRLAAPADSFADNVAVSDPSDDGSRTYTTVGKKTDDYIRGGTL